MDQSEVLWGIPRRRGSIEVLYLAREAQAPMIAVNEACMISGRGMEGDRYCLGIGTHCAHDDDEPHYEVTLIEGETIEALRREKKIELDFDAPRRNIVTRDFPLHHMVKRTFRIGEVILRGIALREPCMRMIDLTDHGIAMSLIHRGGLGAQILTGGVIRIGDVIEEI
ncbi:MAG TPA: MOSC domain-containing protein [Ktedonobacteraceae bacterium]|jgi:MOSC domain-containing protein YiiM|nr:MOSC domain-containing protein [Ktedonobacteraceae bacterium]